METFDPSIEALPGIADRDSRECLTAQLIESMRRRRFVVEYLRSAKLSDSCLVPATGKFDPIRGAILKSRDGELDEACWLVFLSVQFGYHRKRGWDLVSAFYGRDGGTKLWTWEEASRDLPGVRAWLDANRAQLSASGLAFGNHRKYESLSGSSGPGTGSVVSSYVGWVASAGHAGGRPEAVSAANGEEQFRLVFKAMKKVHRFGRIARFDYLTMLGKTGVFPALVPDSTYLANVSGPRAGASLLLDGGLKSQHSPRQLERRLVPIREAINVTNDVLEDALCNWQKSPTAFVPFRG
ncbi:hypothetical protein [Ruania rhizosphaerae]|uniref:alpha-glutamyl/putrescinyl thymine pyrophosphorylase clade 3 protein n=1 Tax=Ruania rhizosphaerae TaxID=1840413 RepID=UPI00135B3E62|nr:hypothetical protein [Ruania rhizosphaerae]